MARPAWRQAPPTALPSASLRAATALADSTPSMSQPVSTNRAETSSRQTRRCMAAVGFQPGISAAAGAGLRRAQMGAYGQRPSVQEVRRADAAAAAALQRHQFERAFA